MAKKKPDMSNIFAKTEKSEEEADKIASRGVGLRESEWAEVDRIAAEQNFTPHSVAAEGLRFFLAELAAGRAQISQEIKTGRINPKIDNLK